MMWPSNARFLVRLLEVSSQVDTFCFTYLQNKLSSQFEKQV